MDGNTTTKSSIVYEHKLSFTKSTILKIRSVLPSGKLGVERTIEIKKENYLPAVKGDNIPSGITAEYYKGRVVKVSDLDGKKPTEKEQIALPQAAKYRIPGYANFEENKFYSTVLTGYLNIPVDGVYYFTTTDELWLHGNLFITNENVNTARRFSLEDKSIALAKGLHPFKLIRLGAIFGGWPTQWDSLELSIRKSEEKGFKVMGAPYFK